MADATEIVHPNQRLAASVLTGAERTGLAVPGARGAVLRRFAEDPYSEPHVMMGKAVRYLLGESDPRSGEHRPGEGRGLLDPAHQAKAEHPLRTVLGLMVAGGIVKSESSDRVFREVAAHPFVVGRDVGGVAEYMGKAITDRAMNYALTPAHQVAPPRVETDTTEALRHFRPLLAEGETVPGLLEWALQFARGVGSGPRLYRSIAEALARHGKLAPGVRINWADPVFSDRPLTDAERADRDPRYAAV